jgi:hypothetical protein
MAHDWCLRFHDRGDVVNVPPTAAELAADGDAFAHWERNMPQREPRKRKQQLDTRQFTVDEQITAALEAHKAHMDQVLVGVIAELQHRLDQRCKALEIQINDLRVALEVEQRVNAQMVQLEQRHQRGHINGHA